MAAQEIERKALPGVVGLVAILLLLGVSVWSFVAGLDRESALVVLLSVFLFVAGIVGCAGFFIVQPNQAAVLVLFGKYSGSVKHNGWWWVNPFTSKHRVSLRARNFDGEKLKVNDRDGNPIEIAAVVVWRVVDTFASTFEVDDYAQYVVVQGDSAVRHLAKAYPYDEDDEHGISLRGDTDTISEALKRELQARVSRAGVVIDEARLSHLAYAPEIASAMLQRQQAAAIIAARSRIVEGAVSMVQMALEKLRDRNVVHLDEERKAAMVSNLLVVLTSERGASPVINAGSIYS